MKRKAWFKTHIPVRKYDEQKTLKTEKLQSTNIFSTNAQKNSSFGFCCYSMFMEKNIRPMIILNSLSLFLYLLTMWVHQQRNQWKLFIVFVYGTHHNPILSTQNFVWLFRIMSTFSIDFSSVLYVNCIFSVSIVGFWIMFFFLFYTLCVCDVACVGELM